VESFVRSRRWDLEVLLSPEESLLGTGGGLKNARDLLGATEPFFVHNADIFSELDLTSLAQAHRPADLATLAVMDRPTSRALLFDERGVLVGWANGDGGTESVPGTVGAVKRRAFSGVQIVSPLIFDYLERDTGDFSIIRTYLHGARSGAFVREYAMDGVYWVDIGTPEKLAEVRARVGESSGG
jgi:NDP-sugar pyrophosphorylase family protein